MSLTIEQVLEVLIKSSADYDPYEIRCMLEHQELINFCYEGDQ